MSSRGRGERNRKPPKKGGKTKQTAKNERKHKTTPKRETTQELLQIDDEPEFPIRLDSPCYRYEVGGISIALLDADFWEELYKNQNEMLIGCGHTRRRSFPIPVFQVSGLKKDSMYGMCLLIKPADNKVYRYSVGKKKWVDQRDINQEESEFADSLECNYYRHQSNPNKGSFWMDGPISFYNLKLANKVNTCGAMVLQSSRRYYMVLTITNMREGNVVRFPLPKTGFIAVKAHQNEAIALLKIRYNREATAYRRALRANPKTERETKNQPIELSKDANTSNQPKDPSQKYEVNQVLQSQHEQGQPHPSGQRSHTMSYAESLASGPSGTSQPESALLRALLHGASSNWVSSPGPSRQSHPKTCPNLQPSPLSSAMNSGISPNQPIGSNLVPSPGPSRQCHPPGISPIQPIGSNLVPSPGPSRQCHAPGISPIQPIGSNLVPSPGPSRQCYPPGISPIQPIGSNLVPSPGPSRQCHAPGISPNQPIGSNLVPSPGPSRQCHAPGISPNQPIGSNLVPSPGPSRQCHPPGISPIQPIGSNLVPSPGPSRQCHPPGISPNQPIGSNLVPSPGPSRQCHAPGISPIQPIGSNLVPSPGPSRQCYPPGISPIQPIGSNLVPSPGPSRQCHAPGISPNQPIGSNLVPSPGPSRQCHAPGISPNQPIGSNLVPSPGPSRQCHPPGISPNQPIGSNLVPSPGPSRQCHAPGISPIQPIGSNLVPSPGPSRQCHAPGISPIQPIGSNLVPSPGPSRQCHPPGISPNQPIGSNLVPSPGPSRQCYPPGISPNQPIGSNLVPSPGPSRQCHAPGISPIQPIGSNLVPSPGPSHQSHPQPYPNQQSSPLSSDTDSGIAQSQVHETQDETTINVDSNSSPEATNLTADENKEIKSKEYPSKKKHILRQLEEDAILSAAKRQQLEEDIDIDGIYNTGFYKTGIYYNDIYNNGFSKVEPTPGDNSDGVANQTENEECYSAQHESSFEQRIYSSACLPTPEVKVKNLGLWEMINGVMIITEEPRLLFPNLSVSVSNLMPNHLYHMQLIFTLATAWMFEYIDCEWRKSIKCTDPLEEDQVYSHPESPKYGQEWTGEVTFDKLRVSCRDVGEDTIKLDLRRKYCPILIINKSWKFYLTETAFVTVGIDRSPLPRPMEEVSFEYTSDPSETSEKKESDIGEIDGNATSEMALQNSTRMDTVSRSSTPLSSLTSDSDSQPIVTFQVYDPHVHPSNTRYIDIFVSSRDIDRHNAEWYINHDQYENNGSTVEFISDADEQPNTVHVNLDEEGVKAEELSLSQDNYSHSLAENRFNHQYAEGDQRMLSSIENKPNHSDATHNQTKDRSPTKQSYQAERLSENIPIEISDEFSESSDD